MTGDALASALIDRGADGADHPAKAVLFDRVLEAFRATASHPPQHAWWVPGRLEVFGKHTDYAGGRTLVAAVPRGFAVVAAPREDRTLRVIDALRAETFIVDIEEAAGTVHSGWRHYVEVVARRFARNFPGRHLGADVGIMSDLPRASGMSSSSALVIGVATALARIGGLEHHPAWRANIRSPLDAAAYYATLENGLSYGVLSGDAGVGTHGGSEDHAAIVMGQPDRLTAFAFVPMARLADVEVPAEWRFVVTPCGVTSEKTGAAMHRYNRLSDATRLLLALWNRNNDAPARSLGDALRSAPDASARLRELIHRAPVDGWRPGALERRLDHFVREDARTVQALEAFRRRDAQGLGELADGSQRDAELLLGNQIPETSALARQARALGALASCSFGAGFGGSVWALVERDSSAALASRWHPSAFTARPGPGLTELAIPNP